MTENVRNLWAHRDKVIREGPARLDGWFERALALEPPESSTVVAFGKPQKRKKKGDTPVPVSNESYTAARIAKVKRELEETKADLAFYERGASEAGERTFVGEQATYSANLARNRIEHLEAEIAHLEQYGATQHR